MREMVKPRIYSSPFNVWLCCKGAVGIGHVLHVHSPLPHPLAPRQYVEMLWVLTLRLSKPGFVAKQLKVRWVHRTAACTRLRQPHSRKVSYYSANFCKTKGFATIILVYEFYTRGLVGYDSDLNIPKALQVATRRPRVAGRECTRSTWPTWHPDGQHSRSLKGEGYRRSTIVLSTYLGPAGK
jgi:hypothetical protein